MVRLDLPSLAAIVLDVRKTLAPVIHFLPVEAFALNTHRFCEVQRHGIGWASMWVSPCDLPGARPVIRAR